MRSIDFIQIIYDDLQAEHCYPFARVYKNETLTPYFENSVIEKIIKGYGGVGGNGNDDDASHIGICSWRLMQKRGDCFRVSQHTLTPERLAQDYDVAILTPRSKTHKPLLMASHWHGEAWDKSFAVFKRFLKTDLGVTVPEELKTAVYENHFVARTEIYKDYVDNWLTPSIEFMYKHPVFMEDAGYAKRKTADECRRYFELTGRKDWPIAPFVLERLFSIYLEGKNLNVIAL